MEEILKQIGLNKTDIKIYLFLLENHPQTAAQVAKATKESRTNTYMVLERLIGKGLILQSGEAVKIFAAAEPKAVLEQISQKQRDLINLKRNLDEMLPELVTNYRLNQQKPGTLFLQGIDGLKASLVDMEKSKTEVLLWGGSDVVEQSDIWKLMDKSGMRRKFKGVKTRCILEAEAANWKLRDSFWDKGFETRAVGKLPFIAEVAIYDNKVVISRYGENIIITVITDEAIADTFRAIFEASWQTAKPLASEKA